MNDNDNNKNNNNNHNNNNSNSNSNSNNNNNNRCARPPVPYSSRSIPPIMGGMGGLANQRLLVCPYPLHPARLAFGHLTSWNLTTGESTLHFHAHFVAQVSDHGC